MHFICTSKPLLSLPVAFQPNPITGEEISQKEHILPPAACAKCQRLAWWHDVTADGNAMGGVGDDWYESEDSGLLSTDKHMEMRINPPTSSPCRTVTVTVYIH